MKKKIKVFLFKDSPPIYFDSMEHLHATMTKWLSTPQYDTEIMVKPKKKRKK